MKRFVIGLLACVCAMGITSEARATVVIDPFGKNTTETEAADNRPDYLDHADTRPEDWVPDDSVVIADGISVSGISLSGMRPSEAVSALTDFYENVSTSPFCFRASGKVYNTTLEALGFSYDIAGIVEDAAYAGQYGPLIHRYKTLMDLKNGSLSMDVYYSIDEEKIKAYVKDQIAADDVLPVDATITRKDGEFIVTDSVVGREVDVDATVQTAVAAVMNQLSANMTVEATVKTVVPDRTTEALSTIQDKLGTFSTDYSDSAEGRKANLKVGSGNLNGTVLMPGESCSTSQTMQRRTPENGYQLATEYLDGENVEAYGGGVCQVATTLYNALLRAEIQIDKRYNHSMLVSYVDPSFDSAISWGTKDLVFTNNLDHPIYIAASANGYTLTFSIYGTEYRPENRKIKFRSVIIERIASEDILKEDPLLPVGTVEKTGHNHDKCKSYLVKEIYVDGKLTETINFKTDEYIASHRTVTTGTMPLDGSTAAEGETTPDGEPVTPSDPAESSESLVEAALRELLD